MVKELKKVAGLALSVQQFAAKPGINGIADSQFAG